jgi:hypothetical protein
LFYNVVKDATLRTLALHQTNPRYLRTALPLSKFQRLTLIFDWKMQTRSDTENMKFYNIIITSLKYNCQSTMISTISSFHIWFHRYILYKFGDGKISWTGDRHKSLPSPEANLRTRGVGRFKMYVAKTSKIVSLPGL